jgi:hypothetical protein
LSAMKHTHSNVDEICISGANNKLLHRKTYC